MNKYLLIGLLSYILYFDNVSRSYAQANQHVNISSQPAWGPAGYNEADYYYLPGIESYYCVATRQFIYLNGGRWIFTNNQPSKYAKYDLYSGYKVIINKPRAYLNFNQDRLQYSKLAGYHGHQVSIRDAKNAKYKNLDKRKYR